MAEPDRPRGRISLVIPCYNAARFVAEALDSALAQSRAPDEIVVVDDGSTDDSAAVVARYAPAVRLIRQANAGDGAARNRGIAETSGAYVAFLDADDLWPVDSLARRLEALEAAPEAAFAYGAIRQFRTGAGKVPAGPEGAGRVAGATLFRRALFEAIGGFRTDIRLGTMIEWIGRATAAGHRGTGIADTVLHRRVHDSNSARQEEALKADYLRALRAAVAHKRTNSP